MFVQLNQASGLDVRVNIENITMIIEKSKGSKTGGADKTLICFAGGEDDFVTVLGSVDHVIETINLTTKGTIQ